VNGSALLQRLRKPSPIFPATAFFLPRRPASGRVALRRIGHYDVLESVNFEKVQLLGKDWLANPCREMLAGELRSP
jgi:hypothetical protein